MEVEKLIRLIKSRYRKPGCLYHFTDVRNISSIARNGILSKMERERIQVEGAITGGNDWSHQQDQRKGLTDFVHLCFFDNHPMEYIAKKENRIDNTYFIKVLPEILDREGVRFCAGVSNAKESELFGVDEFENYVDMKALFRRMEWKNEDELARVRATEKYEILIPKRVPKSFLRK